MKLYPFLIAVVLLSSCVDKKDEQADAATGNTTVIPAPVNLNYSIVKIYPHDTSSFTQGLIWHNNTLYEGTGLNGQSRLMKVDLASGKHKQKIELAKEYFGEGITILNDKIYQLTYQEHKVFVYELASFKKIKEFEWNMEGWGLTHNGKQLIVSTGSSNIYFVNPETFAIERTLGVFDNNGYLDSINELEFINGSIYANVYLRDLIVKINPETGVVEGRIDLTDILHKTNQSFDENIYMSNGYVLNGIAYNPATNSFYITGKKWPALYEIKLN
ncbi:MAG TPA: glutamine cyclotransferase [Chitinophagaceae bacterium]|nr:glutamine cyclotransferase [Chitinophagaceae bacterium]